MKREYCNMEIMNRLWEYLMANPDIRFCQALLNLGVVEENEGLTDWKDSFYEEPNETLERMKRIEKERV